MGDKTKKRKGLPGTQEMPNGQAELNGSVRKKARHPKKTATPAARAADDTGISTSPQHRTVSIAVSAAAIDNAQSSELATAMAGQIARTAAIFNVDEVVVIDEFSGPEHSIGQGAAFLARILQFMETPQYLRKALIPMHKDLRLSGQLPPLDAPHHMRATEWGVFREGVVLSSAPGAGSLLDIGLDKSAHVEEALQPLMRATLEMGPKARTKQMAAGPLGGAAVVLEGMLALPSTPKAEAGTYWGYTVRIAKGLTAALSDSPFEGGYDLKIGTSERGEKQSAAQLKLPEHEHALIAFGGPLGLEDCYERDSKRASEDVTALFDIL
ncbi:g4109 [Coccomyxa viridis]|uniref:G4109 protein n=1 Tax=Coccomyxa viridis TaxID=1274662 RepID=A0ABP1FRT1_9CHLO